MKLIHCLKIENWKLKIVLATLFLFFVLPEFVHAGLISSVPSSLGLTSGLVGWWAMDEKDISGTSITDKSGNSNTGTISGATKAVGKLGQALSFDGSDDYVGMAQNSSLKPANALTFSAWIKHSGVASEADCLVWDGGSADAYGIRVDNSGAEGYRIHTSNFSGDVQWITTVNTDWHLLTGVFNGSITTLSMYFDGIFIDSDTSAGATITYGRFGSQQLRLGADGDGTACGAIIDDVRIYNRALSAEEVKRLYNMGQGVKTGVTPKKTITSGLVGWWTMDESSISGVNITDFSVEANTATTTTATKGLGKIGQAMCFDGVDDYLGVSNDSSLQFNGQAFSVSLWMKVNSVSFDERNLLSKDNLNNGNQFPWRLYSYGTSIYFSIRDASEVSRSINVPAATIAKDQWYHVLATFNPAGYMKLYVNSALSGTPLDVSGYTFDGSSGVHPLHIGSLSYAAAQYMNGCIDDVKIYNRELSADEVKELYNEGKGIASGVSPVNSLTSGLVGYWTFDGTKISGTNATDSSSGGHTGVLTGNATPGLGKIGQGVALEGTGDYVSVTNPGNHFDGGTVSIAAWVKPTSLTNTYPRIVDRVYNGQFAFYISAATAALGAAINATTADVDTTTLCPAETVKNGIWQHLAMVYDGQTVYGYKNGVQCGMDTTPNGYLANSTSDLRIGERVDIANGTRAFTGAMDEVRVYNRTLSADEVKQLYQMGR